MKTIFLSGPDEGKQAAAEDALAEMRKMLYHLDGPFYVLSFKGGGAATLEIKAFDGKVRLSFIAVPKEFRGQGYASEALRFVTRIADKHGVAVTLDADPQGEGGLTKAQLFKWYERHGFRRLPYAMQRKLSDTMEREPRGRTGVAREEDMRITRIAASVAETYPRKEQVATARSMAPGGGTIAVWYVDGEYVRTYLDEEFTNFAQHYRFGFVPEGEFWIDEEASRDELDFFVEHLRVEHGLMAAGRPYVEAITEGDKAELAMRLAKGDLGRMMDPSRNLVDPRKAKIRLLKTLEGGVAVWLVDGRLVRSALNIDFTQGGHDYVYEFVPENEVWIDNDVSWKERAFVILHELHERNRMAAGWPYGKAHAESSALELRSRRNPVELHDNLVREGWGN